MNPMKVISLGFRTDLMLRRLAGSEILDRASHLVVRTPTNPGYHWGNFVLFNASPARDDAPRWSTTFSSEFPRATHLALGVDGTDGDTGDPTELARLGVTPEVNCVLSATRLRSPARPTTDTDTDTHIRPLTSAEDWAQALDLRLACEADDEEDKEAAEGPLTSDHRQFIEAKQSEYRALCEAGHGAWFGAFVDGRMRAGVGVFSDGSGPARFQNVETHPRSRRQGLASSLVHHAGNWALTELRARTLVIVADPDYHAIRLYRALGFTDTERQVQLNRRMRPAAAPGNDAHLRCVSLDHTGLPS